MSEKNHAAAGGRFAVGYQLAEPGEESFVDLLGDHLETVAEVYCAPPGEPSGRAALPADQAARARFSGDMRRLRRLGVKVDLLFNAACYGADAMSRALEKRVVDAIADLEKAGAPPDLVTTTSPAVAHVVGRHFPGLERRASVNMRLGSVAAMAYLADLFESFHVRRDHNRDPARLDDLHGWAERAGKKLVLLANSGCLRDCSGQSFHDNLVAHEAAAARRDNLPDFLPYACWRFLQQRENWPAILQATWIRPEDLHHYTGRFPLVKLATRLHQRPHAVLAAYARGRFAGNLADLLEPGFSPLLAPWVIDNSRFPADWFARVTSCDRRCHRCGYCRETLEKTLVRLG